MHNGKRTVLVVDDDPQILRLLESMLKPRRVKVLVTARPAEALEICKREPVHPLISDVKMPEMDGRRLAERVLAVQPEASILLISGRTTDPVVNNAPQVHFLRKPFFPSQLMEHLRKLLP